MAQNNFDQLSKQYLEEFLAPFGIVQRQYEVPDELPQLWILAATTSNPLLKAAKVDPKPDWLAGIYFMADVLKTAIVAIDELPETAETLLIRILGRGSTQERAIREVLAMPPSNPKRNTILQMLANWKVRIDLGELANFAEREELMALSEAFLVWEQETRQEGAFGKQAEIVRNMLKEQLSLEQIARWTGLTIEQIQQIQTS